MIRSTHGLVQSILRVVYKMDTDELREMLVGDTVAPKITPENVYAAEQSIKPLVDRFMDEVREESFRDGMVYMAKELN